MTMTYEKKLGRNSSFTFSFFVFCLFILFSLFLSSCYCEERKILANENEYFNKEEWKLTGLAPENELITVRLYLYQQNIDKLNFEFERRTNPKSPLWRKWLKTNEILQIVAPTEESVKIVTNWLNQFSNLDHQIYGDFFIIDATVKTINEMFTTSLHSFTHLKTGKKTIRHLGEYSLPAHVAKEIQFVLGINGFPFIGGKPLKKHDLRLDETTNRIVPYVIDQLYNINYTLAYEINHNTSIGVAEFEDNIGFNTSDLSYFQSMNLLPNNPVPQNQIIGPFTEYYPDGESSLDIQYASGVSYNASNWYYTVKGWMLEFATEIIRSDQFPYVISISWGWTENNQCDVAPCSSSEEYISRVNIEFQKIGLKGITLVVSSGDLGAPGEGNPKCSNHQDPLSSIFPGASPFVLSVGGTMLISPYETTVQAKNIQTNNLDNNINNNINNNKLNNNNDKLNTNNINNKLNKNDNNNNNINQKRRSNNNNSTQPIPPICELTTCAKTNELIEVACTYPEALITSGGGFSDYSPRPSWQNDVVNEYLSSESLYLPPSNYFNSSNRGFPDVSAIAHNYLVYIEGIWSLIDGTSAAAPVWAAIISLINQFELNEGRGPMGFINPLIYQAYNDNQNIFFDIVNGNNFCTEKTCCQNGFYTSKGWDPVTGLGTPNFDLLLAYVQSLN